MALINNIPSLGIPVKKYTSRQRIKKGTSRYSNKPEDKTLIKFNTEYNKEIDSEYQIDSIKELKEKINLICQKC